MKDFKTIFRDRLAIELRRDPQSKHNQSYYLREDLVNSLVKYAQVNAFTEEQFEQALEESLSIFEDLFTAFEPYRQSTGDCGDFWLHQYIDPKKYITEANYEHRVVNSANGLLDDAVQRYIQQPAMHTRRLTTLLLDAYLYNDTIILLNSVKIDWLTRNRLYPSKSYSLTRIALKISGLALAILIGAVIYKNAPGLLTPYVLIYLYLGFKGLSAESAKKFGKELFNYSLENYTNSDGRYNHEQMSTILRHSHEKYGVRYKSTIYELVELLKQPW